MQNDHSWEAFFFSLIFFLFHPFLRFLHYTMYTGIQMNIRSTQILVIKLQSTHHS